MPRFDPYFKEIRHEFDRENYNPDDPGDTAPVDLCVDCAASFDEEWTCDHPPYEEQFPPYKCEECKESLTEDDNDWH